MVLCPDISLVSIDPEAPHDVPSRDARTLASGRLSTLLALEIVLTGRAALVTSNQSTQVATLDGNNKVVLKNVQLGRDLGDSVEVIAGLSPSDRIINNPPETLIAGDTVRVAAATPPTAPASSSTTSRQ